jgi:hypothetical protein
MGAYPDKAVGVLRSVALRMEQWLRQEKFGGVLLPQIASTPDGRVSEEVRRYPDICVYGLYQTFVALQIAQQGTRAQRQLALMHACDSHITNMLHAVNFEMLTALCFPLHCV